MKKLLSLLLSVAMVLSLVSTVNVFAEENNNEQITAEPTTEKVEYKDIADVVPSDAETKTLRFYMPEDWKTTYSETYDGKELSSCVPGIYWWEGSYNCDDYYGKEKAWPGYYISKTEEDDSNIFVAEVPKDVKQIMFNNMVKTENNDNEQNPDRYNASVKTSLITAEGYQSGEDMYGFYPDGLESVEDMVFVPYKSDIVELDSIDNGEWFYYYGDGKYGAYKTLAMAEANDAVYSGGQFPENNNDCEQPEETEVTETTTGKVEYKDIADVVPSDAETKTIRFYMPEDWKTTYSETYDGKELSSCVPGIYWWEGSYNCDDYYGKEKAWPGYYISKTEEAGGNIFTAEVPRDVKQIMFNNMVKTGNNDYEENPDRYNASVKTSFITAEGYQPGEDMYGFYPDGLESVENMIFVPYKSDVVTLDRVDNGEWFYYYGGGKYGAYKTLAEAEANDAVYSGGQFPEKRGCDQPAETEVTEPTTAEPATEAVESTTAEPTTEVTEPTTVNTAAQPSKAAAPAKENNKKTVKPAVKANPIKVTVKAKSVKAKKLVKKAQKIKAVIVKNAVGKVTYKLASVPKKIKKLVKINKKGVITLAKGKYAKKTYKIKVQVTAAGNKYYTSKTILATIKIKLK